MKGKGMEEKGVSRRGFLKRGLGIGVAASVAGVAMN